jgi:RHS repeat-associated protein
MRYLLVLLALGLVLLGGPGPARADIVYLYDDLGRLVRVIRDDGEAATYHYDPVGNILQITRESGVAQTTAVTSTSATSGFQGIIVPVTVTGSNLTSITDESGTTALQWDSRNRLTALTRPGMEASFAYDVFGRRVRKTVNGITTQYLYDGPDVVAEIREGATTPYLRLLGVDTPISRGLGEVYLTDGLGTVVGLSDADGVLATRYSYSPFGDAMLSGLPSDNPLGFTAREVDETGLLYYRARYYSPRLHRFLSQDLALRLGANRYAYALNNPITGTDPFGLDTLVINGGSASSGPGGSSAGANPLNRGLNQLVRTLRENGEPVQTFNSGQWREVASAAQRIARAGRPVFIVGHSLGGEAAVRAAVELLGLGITPDHVFTIDPFVQPGVTIPPGLPLTNFYQEQRYLLVIRGFEIGGAQRNVLIEGTDHFEITRNPQVQETITNAILGASRAQPVGGRY